MANIQVNEIESAGLSFFKDSESFLDDLSKEEILLSKGGATITVTFSSEPCALFVFAGVTVILNPDKKD